MPIDFLDEEDLYDLHKPLELYEQISNEDLKLAYDCPLVVSYHLIDLEATDYHFFQEFTHRDTQMYFKRMQELSSATINELDENARQRHFYRSPLKGKLLQVLRKIEPDIQKANPLIFHFDLYTDKDVVADRDKNIRQPRIYFMLGRYGVMYILFFDPYHEINPINSIIRNQ